MAYAVDAIEDVSSDAVSLMNQGYIPLNAYVKGDSLAFEVSMQVFSSKWYVVARNFHTQAMTLNNVRLLFYKP